MIKLFFISSFTLSSFFIVGQSETDETKNRKSNIQLNFGLVHCRLIDEGYTGSKLLFKGTNSKFSLGYGRETKQDIFNVLTAGSFGNVASKGSNLNSNFDYINFYIEYLRKNKQFEILGQKNEFIAGIHLSSINYVMNNEHIFDNVSIFSLHGVYFNVGNHFKLNEKHGLQLIYLLPTIVYTNRVLYNSGASEITYEDLENIPRTLTTFGEFTYFDLFDNVQIHVNYLIKIGENVDFQVKYKFFFVENNIEAPLHIYSNEFLFGLKIRI